MKKCVQKTKFLFKFWKKSLFHSGKRAWSCALDLYRCSNFIIFSAWKVVKWPQKKILRIAGRSFPLLQTKIVITMCHKTHTPLHYPLPNIFPSWRPKFNYQRPKIYFQWPKLYPRGKRLTLRAPLKFTPNCAYNSNVFHG